MLAAASRLGRTSGPIFAAPIRALSASSSQRAAALDLLPMSGPQSHAVPPQSGAQRRGRSRPSRGRGIGRGGGTGLVQAVAARGAPVTEGLALPDNLSGVARAQAFSTTPGLSAGYQSERKFKDTSLNAHLKNVIPWEFMSEIQAQTVDVRPPSIGHWR